MTLSERIGGQIGSTPGFMNSCICYLAANARRQNAADSGNLGYARIGSLRGRSRISSRIGGVT